METNALPTPDEAAAALRDAERARTSIKALPARPWFYPLLAVIFAGMTVAMLLLGGFGVVVVALTVVAITMITRRHTEAVGVQPNGPSGWMELRQMVPMIPLMAVYVFGCATYYAHHRPWAVVLAAVALGADMLVLGWVSRPRRVS